MSEDRPDGDADAPAPDAPAVEPARRPRWIYVAGAGVVALVVALIVGNQVRSASGPAASGSSGGSAALRAGEGPTLPGAPSGPRLTGVIVDGTGAPVVGAEVSCELERGVVDRALATAPVPAPGSAGSGSASVVVVAPITGADGRFVLAGLVSGRYRIRVTGPGLLPAEVRYVPVPSDDTRIVVARQVKIEGVVVDGPHRVANATVGLRGDAIGGAIEVKTDAHGAFSFVDLPEGRYQLFAWRESLAARAMRVNRLGAGPFPPIELRLESASIVVGRVIDRDEGTGLAAAVELRPSGDDQAPRYARSGADGVFRIEGVPTGKWIADAFAPGYTSPGGVEIEAGRGVPELALARGATIEGRVVDGEGRPIAGAAVRALTGSGTSTTELSAAVDQDRLRRFSGRIAAPTPSAFTTSTADPQLLPRGELGVLVGPIPPIPPPGLQIARPAQIDPTVASLAGEPAPLPEEPARMSIWTTGADGRYRIRGLPRGKVTALAVAGGFAEGRSRQLTIEPGQVVADVDITLTAGTLLVGKVTDQRGGPVPGAQVSARPELGAAMDAFTDDTGIYRLGPVAGTVELSASAYGHGEARRTLELPSPPGRNVAERREDIVLAVADAVLSGMLDDARGAPIAAATLEVISGAGEGRRAVVGADGTFRIDHLPAGALRLRITHPDYPPSEVDATATAAPATVRFKLALGGAIEGAILDDRGAPLAGTPISGDGPGTATADTTSDTKGYFKLGPLVPGVWKLAIDVPGFLAVTRELEVTAARAPGQASVRDVRIDLARGALVGGTVRDARGQRARNARVSVQRADGTGPTIEGVTDSAGEFRLRDCPTGELSVTAQLGDARGSARAMVRPGTEVLSLALEIR